ncbi:hypothetical protein RHMOL_Rhmol08G0214600 [Rhododendron molle]|uniref:Uncharacterized protein n=1 Tax=Rhododendron molle TaxID=49168 RepID=A0ACC0MR44_RHOML|nr:hypothetical protein RHMOL_Rhmol08G0214600 [Rhododendron molle]
MSSVLVRKILLVLEVKAFPPPFLNCKSLTLDLHIADEDLLGIAKFIDNSPYLETLVISTETSYPSEFSFGDVWFDRYSSYGVTCLKSRKKIPEGLLLHLKKVTVFGFRRTCCEVELVHFLLKNAGVLENMNIYLPTKDFLCQPECSGWREIVNEELNLPASSPHAVVRFFEEEFVEA